MRENKKNRIRASYLFSILGAIVFTVALCTCTKAGDRRDLLGNGHDFTSILYDSSNGLPTSEANAIAQSRDGFIWLGGYSGLVRYDGTSFYRFDATSGISSVFSLFVDSKDRVWIGTNENGVACFDHGEIRVYGRAEGEKSYSVRSLCEDENGNIIIATTQGLCYVGKDDNISAIDDPQINQEYITELTTDEDGKILGLTLDGAIFKMSGLRISAFYGADLFGEEAVNTIYPRPGHPGELLAGTTGSKILTISLGDKVKISEEQQPGELVNIKCIREINNILWVSATNGIGYFDEQQTYHDLEDIPLNNSVGHIMTDHEGNIWFTSTRQGVLKLVPDRFTDISKNAGLESTVVNSTCVSDGLLYLATDAGLLILREEGYGKVENELTEYLSGVRIRCIMKDSGDNLWFCTHGDTGLVKYEKGGAITSYGPEAGLDAGKVRDVIECSDGRIAAATGNGLYILKDGKVSEHYSHQEGINNTEVLCVEEGPDGKLYLGSDGDGIYVVGDRKVSRLSFEDGLTSGVVMRIKYDPEEELFWLVTSNSISYLKNNTITAVDQFPYSNNLDLIFDDHGGAWVLSSNGIYITKKSELLENKKIEYSFYNTKSGLPYVSTSNSRSFLSDSGQLYISGTTGVCMVNINADSDSEVDVKLTVPYIDVDGKTFVVDPEKGVSIPAGSKKLVVNAFVITYGLSNPRVSYYLEGFDKTPVHTTKQELSSVVYTNLDGGDYTFHLEVIDDKTGKAKQSLAVPINKESSPYESIWFWVILMGGGIAVVGAIIWQYFRKQTEALQEEHEEDQRFIDQIMYTFAKCVDMRDSQNRGHSFRVAHYTFLLAKKLAFKRGYTDDQIHEFYNIALLHDIGKLSIPDAILNKPARLNDEEYVIMKTHAARGEEILRGVAIVPDLAVGAGCHHERIDGRGYPHGLVGDKIPEVARIIAVADTFDAMYSTRPYRKQMLLSDVLSEIDRIKGTQLDPDVVEALYELGEDGELDREKVDKAVAMVPSLIGMPTGDEVREKEEEKARKSEEFQNGLGLHKKE